MTREEAKRIANAGKTLQNVDSQCAKLIDKIYDDFEAPKTCETCKWRNCLASEMYPCTHCDRRIFNDTNDHYQSKES